MGQSLASLKGLKALRLYPSNNVYVDMSPLARIKNLKHLDIQGSGGYGNSDVMQSILRNSMSTLEGLVVQTSTYAGNFFQDWEGKVMRETHDFTALKLLSLSGILVNENVVKSLYKAIDFMRLSELTIADFEDDDALLMQHHTRLAISSQGTDAGINLRTLSLKMSDGKYTHTSRQNRVDFEAKCRFISTFDTLTHLDLPDYGQYSDDIATNPGLSSVLLQAILKHKHLRTLRISYTGITSGLKIPYLSATAVGAIIDGLPHLQEFEFAPEEAHMVGVDMFRLID
jgi:hypothetical protein